MIYEIQDENGEVYVCHSHGPEPKDKQALCRLLSIAFADAFGDDENRKEKDPELYKKLRHSALGICMNFKTKFGFAIDKAGYVVARKIFNFN